MVDVDKQQEAQRQLQPRPYQIELLNKAIKQNSIVFLGTGAGKTFIAVMLIKEFGDTLRSSTTKKTVFLVSTVALATQQRDYLERQTGFQVRSFCGSDGVDNWTPEQWKQEIDQHQVLVFVHQVFLDLLNKNLIKMQQLNLLILDEVHHTAKNHPYAQIMKQYKEQKEQMDGIDFRVVGLTASIVKEKCDKSRFVKLKCELEELTDCKVITTENLASVLKYATAPDEHIAFFTGGALHGIMPSLNTIIEEGCEVIEEKLNNRLLEMEKEISGIPYKIEEEKEKKFVKKVLRLLRNLSSSFESLGIYASEKLLAYYEEDLLEEKKELAEDLFTIEVFEIASEIASSLRSNINKEFLTHGHLDELARLEYFSSSKVIKLLEILREKGEAFRPEMAKKSKFDSLNFYHKSNMTALIFVQMRQTSAVLSYILEKASLLDPSLEFLKVSYVVGQAKNVFNGKFISPEALKIAEEERKKMEETLRQFRCGELNALVSTSVLEEGMDVKKCNVVIRFDPIPEFRSYVQSKGRARAKPSEYIVFVEEGDIKSEMKIGQYKKIEEESIELSHQEYLNDDEPMTPDEIEVYWANPDDRQNSARVDSLSSISLVSRYVQKLPADRFTNLLPYFEYKKESQSPREMLLNGLGLMQNVGSEQKSYRCSLHLPHLTPFPDPIEGPRKSSKILAKRAVALKACELLHKAGELDEKLRPVSKRKQVDEDDSDDETDSPLIKRKTGTKKCKRYYPVIVPECLRNLMPAASSTFLHKIDLRMIRAINPEENSKGIKLYFPEACPRKLGILLGKPLSAASFTLFTPSGEVLVTIKKVGERIVNVSEISCFHRALFEDVLRVTPPWLKYDDQSHEGLIVPLHNDNIDYRLIEKFKFSHNTTPPKRDNYVFEGSLYDDAVIIPRHKEDAPRCFIDEILFKQNVETMMDSDTSFKSYYKEKYDCVVTQTQQPLLRCRNADTHHDMNNPIQQSGKTKTSKVNEDFLASRWRFIPELVDIHPMPASLWQEGQLLPFALNRLRMVLNAVKIRDSFCEHFNMETSSEKTDVFRAPPMVFNRKRNDCFEHLIDEPNLKSLVEVPDIETLVAPLTTKGCGESFDLERDEILGDSFLKYATSVHVFFKHEAILNEGDLTSLRSKIVGNKNLYRAACKKGIDKLINFRKLEPFKNLAPPRYGDIIPNVEKTLTEIDLRWRETKEIDIFKMISHDDIMQLCQDHPHEFETKLQSLLEDRECNYDGKREALQPRKYFMIGDKSIADSIEALIGCFLREVGQGGALRFLKFLDINLMSDENAWYTPTESALIRKDSLDKKRLEVLMKKVDVEKVENKLGYRFREKSFLLQALTHCSYYPNRVTRSMERLEYLGDAVIDYLITCHIFSKFDDITPGQLSTLRSVLVCNNTFAEIAIRTQLYKELLHQSPRVMSKIDEYVSYVQGGEYKGKTRKMVFFENLLQYNEESCPLEDDIEIPKVLGDLIESLMGAIFIDSGFDLANVWRALTKIFPNMDEIIKEKPEPFVKKLYEKFPEAVKFEKVAHHSKVRGSFVKVEVTLKGDQTARVFGGIGNNNNKAKEAAARCAFRELKNVFRD